MKKFLTSTIVIALVATLMGVFVACGDKGDNGNNDADTATKAIAIVRQMYDGKAEETPTDYEVIGIANGNGKACTVKWTISSDFADYANYITVGEMDATSKKVTIGITKATEEISYKLIATVTVGKASKSAEFNRKVPAGQAQEGQKDITASFVGTEGKRSVFTADQQVWTDNGLTLTNDKGASTTAVNNATSEYHVRIYKGSSVKIEYPGMTKLVFHSEAKYNTSDYPAFLKSSLEAANLGTVTIDGDDVTLVLTAPCDVIEFTASAGQIRIKTLDVVANLAPVSDADKVAMAKAALDIANKNITAVGTYDLPAEKNGATVTWAIKGESANASIDGGKLKVTSMPASETSLTLTATIKVNEAEDTKEFTVKLIPLGLTNDGTAEHPYTTTEAKQVIALLEENATSTEEYYVKGYVIAPGTYNSQYNNFDDMYIADEAGKAITDAAALLIYRPKADGTYLTTEGFTNGDLVTFKGKFQNYKKDETLTPELVSGTCVAREAAERTDTQIVADAKAAVDLAKKTYTKAGEEVTLDASYQGATLAWAVKTETTLVEIAAGKLTIKSIPATATEVTLTVTISSNSVTDTKDIVISVEPLKLDHAGTQADPYSLADVAKIGESLGSGAYYGGETASLVYITGYIVDAGNYNTSYNNFEKLYLIDDYSEEKNKDSEGAVYLFRLYKDDTYVTAADSIAKGDKITVYGYIQNYQGKTLQITYKSGDNAHPCAVYLQKAGEEPKTDAELVAEAKTAVKLAATYEGGEVTLPTTAANGATYTWAVKSGTNVTIEGGKMTLTAGDAEVDVTVTVTITVNDATDTKDISFKVLALSTKGTEADPYTVAEIDAILTALADGATYQVGGANKLVYVQGYVVVVGSDGSYGRDGVKIADAADATDGILIYGHNYNTDLPKGSDLEVGDKVLVSGYLKKYQGTKEIANADTRPNIKITQKVVLTDEQKAQKALKAVDETLGNITAAGEMTLPASTTEGVTFTWSTADTTYTVTDNKLNVAALPTDEDATVTLKVTATCGDATVDKTVTVIVKQDGAPSEVTLYTLTTSTSGSNNSYAKNCDVNVGGVTWNIEGNSTTNPWRFGGKGAVVRSLTGKTAIKGKVTTLEIAFGSATATVNSVTLKVYKTDPTAADAVATYTKAVTYAQGKEQTITVPAEEDWTDCYYQLVFDVTCNSSSNQYVTVTTMTFTGIAVATEAGTETGEETPESTPEAILNDEN